MIAPDTNLERLDKRRVRRSFERAAAGYDQSAVLQREVGQRLLERLDYIRLAPRRVLDLGAGTGTTARGLARRYRRAELVLLDVAPGMLRQARRRKPWFRKFRYIAGDAEALPVADACCDLVFSNLTMQWCNDLARIFGEARRVLAPGGLFLFTTFGPDTLRELRQAWAAADGFRHVSGFPDMHDVGDALLQAGFADPVMDAESFTVTYPDVRGVMDDLRAVGATNATAGRAPGLTGKGRFRAMQTAYEQFRRDGVLPATHEVVYGHGWVPSFGVRRGAREEVAVPVESLYRKPE